MILRAEQRAALRRVLGLSKGLAVACQNVLYVSEDSHCFRLLQELAGAGLTRRLGDGIPARFEVTQQGAQAALLPGETLSRDVKEKMACSLSATPEAVDRCE